MMKKTISRAARILALVLILATVFTVSAAAYEVKGKTLAEVLGMDGAVYYQWLMSHQKDTYYNTTPYAHADHRNPNGDCDGANGALDTPGVPALNCMGFVWHALYMPTKMSGGNTGMIPAYGKGGWYGLYTGYNITRRYFNSKKELLASGYAEPGDIIWMFVVNEHVADDSNHIAIYMGDGHSDRVWHAVKAGTKFGYINPDYEQYIVIKSGVIRKLTTPTLKSVKNTTKGAQITWNKVSGAGTYRVFVKNGSKWKVLGDTKSNTYVDKTAKSGQTYTYTVRCIDQKGRFQSDFNAKGITNTFYAAPSGFGAVGDENGITFTWNAVPGAARYRVYRRTAGSDWEIVGRPYENKFVDTKVKKGFPYLYTARALDSKGNTVSDFNSPIKAYIITDVPKITDASIGNKGLTLTWGKIRGAEQYRIFKKVGSSWKTVGYSDTNSFTYASPDKNVETAYTVRCVSNNRNSMTSGYDRTGYTVLFETAPKLMKIEGAAGGTMLTWYPQQNAKNFRVYRREGSGAWTSIATATGNTYVDTTAEFGKSYTYTLRVLSPDGKKLVSGFDTKGMTMTRVETPEVTTKVMSPGINITWNQIDNATSYRVFIKKDGKWAGLATVTNRSYLFTDVADGEEYTFTVRCIDSSKYFNSYYDTVGKNATYLAPKPEQEPTEAPTEAPAGGVVETGSAPVTEAATAPATEMPTEL